MYNFLFTSITNKTEFIENETILTQITVGYVTESFRLKNCRILQSNIFLFLL